jgi:type 1 glutamine amidotransferase
MRTAVPRVVVLVVVAIAALALAGCQLLQPVLAPLPAPVDAGPFAWPADLADHATRDVVVVLTKTHGYRHDVIDVTAAVVADAARRAGLTPIVTADAAVLDEAVLERVAVVVLAHANGRFATDAQFAALARFVDDGGGLLMLHAAVGDWQAATPWIEMAVGARFVGHSLFPGTETATVVRRRPHAITRRLPPNLVVDDELYAFADVPRGAVVLASFSQGTRVGGALDFTMDGEHPVLWTKAMGRGDVVVFTPGHVASTWRAPWMGPLLEDSLAFLADR